MNITEFIYFILIHWGVLVIAYKYEIKSRIQRLSNKMRWKFLHELSECEFCIEHHLAIVPSVLFAIGFGEWFYLLFPFMGASLFNFIKGIRQ